MRSLILIVFILLICSCPARALIDPFVNQLEEKVKVLRKQAEKAKKNEMKKEVIKEAKLFTPKIPKPLNQLKVQGIISQDGKYYLVLLDPETGETYLIAPGDPVAPDTKVAEISMDRVVLHKFFYKNNKLVREIITLKVDTEGISNG